jgi:hypothetical protein
MARVTALVGTASCAGRSCHGGIEPTQRGVWKIEHTLWSQNDPHARAYQVLLEPLAQDIARRLELPKAHEAPACLSCHTNPAPATHSAPVGAALLRERRFGVGCESCHGNASDWLDAHLSKSWTAKSSEEKWRGHGFVPLGDFTVLVKTCAGCHVGAPANGSLPVRDVNHDLIAAGHPRLAFEAGAFFANLPRHWRDMPGQPNEARLWAVGQVVSAEAALELLRARAGELAAPWPEFAEYACAACHHRLAEPSWRQARDPVQSITPQASSKRALDAMAWGTWHLPLPRALAELDGQPRAALDELIRHMQGPRPSRDAIQRPLDQALGELRVLSKQLAARPWEPADAGKLMRDLAHHRLLQVDSNWESAEQTFLALTALNTVAQDHGMAQKLQALLDVRAFPKGHESPAGFDPTRFWQPLR